MGGGGGGIKLCSFQGVIEKLEAMLLKSQKEMVTVLH